MDIDTLNIMKKEDCAYLKWLRKEENRVLNINNYNRKKAIWDELHPKTDLAIYGLTPEQLAEIESSVY